MIIGSDFLKWLEIFGVPTNNPNPLNFKGVWNANTNTPTLVSSVGTQGDVYIVNVAGNTTLDGNTDWQVGDWAVFNGTVWEKIDTTQSNYMQGAASSTQFAPVVFADSSGKVAENTEALPTGTVFAGRTGTTPAGFTFVPGTNMTSIVFDAVAKTITVNAANQSSSVFLLENLFYIANNGVDATGLTTGVFLTAAGMYGALGPLADVDHQYIAFDIRGKAAATETLVEFEPFIQVFGFGTDLQIGSAILSGAWDALTAGASGAFGYYESLRSGGAGILLDFRNCAITSGKHEFYFTGNKSKIDSAIKNYGVWESGVPRAYVYFDDCNAADISGGNDTYLEFDYGIQGMITDSMLAQIKLNNSSTDPIVSKLIVKNVDIYGRSSSNVGISISAVNAGANVELVLENTANYASGNKLEIDTGPFGNGGVTISNDATSYVTPTYLNSFIGVTINSTANPCAINMALNSGGWVPSNFAPVQNIILNYFDLISWFKGIDIALGTILGAAPGDVYGCAQTFIDTSSLQMGAGTVDMLVSGVWQTLTYASPIVVDANSNGINGLDTGTLAPDTWYYLLSARSPSAPPGWLLTTNPNSPAWPALYTDGRVIGATKTAISVAQFIQYNCIGIGNIREYQWCDATFNSDLIIVNNSTAASGTAVNCYPGQAPETGLDFQSKKVKLYADYIPNAAGDLLQICDQASLSPAFYGMYAQVAAVRIVNTDIDLINPTRYIRWTSTSAGTTTTKIAIRGYTLEI